MRVFQIALCLLMGVMFLLSYTACHRNDCENGFECVEEGCICPEGKYQWGGVCREPAPNEFWGAAPDCMCADTFWLTLTNPTETTIDFSLDRGWYFQKGTMNFEESWLGDTFSISQSFNGLCLGHTTGIYARFLSPDTIRATLKYRDKSTHEVIDQCTFILHK